MATWAGRPATILGRLATPWLPYKRVAKGTAGLNRYLHMMMFLRLQMAMTFPSVAPRRWRSTRLSSSESLVTLVYTM
jgi:hypothetical protein